MMRSLKDLYEDEKPSKDPWEKGKFPGPYHPDTVLVIAGESDDDLGDEDDPGPTMPDTEGQDMVKISRKEYEDLCRKAGM